MKNFKYLLLISHFKFIIINYNKYFKLNFEIFISTIKFKTKLFLLNKNIKFIDLKFIYPNGTLTYLTFSLTQTTTPSPLRGNQLDKQLQATIAFSAIEKKPHPTREPNYDLTPSSSHNKHHLHRYKHSIFIENQCPFYLFFQLRSHNLCILSHCELKP